MSTGSRGHGRLRSGRREPIEARLLIEDEETAGYAFALNERLVLEKGYALKAGEAAAGDIVDQLGGELHAERVA